MSLFDAGALCRRERGNSHNLREIASAGYPCVSTSPPSKTTSTKSPNSKSVSQGPLMTQRWSFESPAHSRQRISGPCGIRSRSTSSGRGKLQAGVRISLRVRWCKYRGSLRSSSRRENKGTNPWLLRQFNSPERRERSKVLDLTAGRCSVHSLVR